MLEAESPEYGTGIATHFLNFSRRKATFHGPQSPQPSMKVRFLPRWHCKRRRQDFFAENLT
jgi:hypothetical protein